MDQHGQPSATFCCMPIASFNVASSGHRATRAADDLQPSKQSSGGGGGL